MSNDINLSHNLHKLQEIATWFDEQSQVDVEEGLTKVKEAAVLIKESKVRLKEIENEFSEIQASIGDENEEEETVQEALVSVTEASSRSTTDDIPF